MSQQLEMPKVSGDTRIDADIEPPVLVTVLMPCLNEARTLAACIDQAHAGCRVALEQRLKSSVAEPSHARSSPPPIAVDKGAVHFQTSSSPRPASGRGAGGEGRSGSDPATRPDSLAPAITYEILIADNGSTDGSPEIAEAHGARVVHVAQKGYGAALLGGIAAARGKYIVMGDSDCSYDFGEVPRFLDKLEEGYDLVMGNRFAGGIMPGAMPWHHRYIGNPVLSGIGRLLYGTQCRDWHCGLRAFHREKMLGLNLACPGMELASEMVLCASQSRLSMAELPVYLRPDGRDRGPHLRSFRDGWRHLHLMLQFLPRVFREWAVMWIVFGLAFLGACVALQSRWASEPQAAFPNPVALEESLGVDDLVKIECLIRSPRKLNILGVRTSCGCIWTDDPPFVVDPDKPKRVLFNLDRRKIIPGASGKINLQVQFLVNGEAKPIVGRVAIVVHNAES